MTLSGQLVNSQDLSARTEDIHVQGHDFNTGPFGDITPEDYDAIQACDTDGSGTCDLHEQLRRRREANHAYGKILVTLDTVWTVNDVLGNQYPLIVLVYIQKQEQDRFPQDVFDGPQKRSNFGYLTFRYSLTN